MSTLFTVSPSSSLGKVFLTDFTFTFSNSATTAYAWDFGDNTFEYVGPSVSHSYKYPGTYTVSGSAWTNTGDIFTDQINIAVDYALSNKVSFTQIPDAYSDPGEKTKTPFVVSLTCTEIEDSLYLSLHSLNSNSIPLQDVPEKWRPITPKWRFVDAITNEIIQDGILVRTSPIYQTHDNISRVVAVTGEASFFYIDDVSTRFEAHNSSPVLLIATLSTSNFVHPPDSPAYSYNSYSNNDSAKAALIWQINDYLPTNLKVTENFISDIYPLKWTNVPIPVMVSCQFDSKLNNNFAQTPSITANLLGYPSTNEIGRAFPINLKLSNTENFVVENSSVYFSSTDEQGNVNSGYVFTSITPVASSLTPLTVIASTSCINSLATIDENSFVFPIEYPVHSNAYVCCPYDGVINKIKLVNMPFADKVVRHYKELGVLSDGKTSLLTLPITSHIESTTEQLTSSAPVYGLAFNPFLNTLYVSNPNTGHIYAFNQNDSTLIGQTKLILGEDNVFPCCLTIDNENNIWTSLYGREDIIKLDTNLDPLFSIAPTTYTPTNILLAPPSIEADKNGNVWACYSKQNSGYLVQYDLSGVELINVPLSSSVPVSLAVDAKNTVWVACYNSNMVLNVSSDGTVLFTLSGGFTRPNHLALDRSNSVWFTHGYNFISVYDQTNKTLTTRQISTLSGISIKTTEAEQIGSIPAENEMWGGLAIDVYDRVWALDSKTNNVIVFNVQNPADLRIIKSQPLTTNFASITLEMPTSGFDIPTSHIHSTQAVGDWTGNKWYQKYTSPTNVVEIEGTSSQFNVFDIDKSYNVAKVNEEFDISNYFKSLALPETLSRNDIFFDEFLAAVAGDGNSTSESAGRVIYERIANFVQTHGDFETSELNQLLSYAKQLSIETKTFGTEFPTEISRLINLFSIPKNQLRGRINYDPDINNNIGSILTQSDLVSAEQYLYAQNKHTNNYQLIYVTPLANGATTYPLSSLVVGGFKTPLKDNYYFYNYVPSKLGYTDNIINWDSPNTTFDYTLSTNEEWYGENGLVETMFNNILTKRLLE